MKITPKQIKEYAYLSIPAIITIASKALYINVSARKILNLDKDDHIELDLEDGRFYIKISPNKTDESFKIGISGKNQLLCFTPGLLGFLTREKIIPKAEKSKFELGLFKNGRYELKFITPKIKNNESNKDLL